MSISSSLEDELLLFPHGTVPAVSVIHSRLRDLYPSFGLDVCNVVKLTFSKCISPASPQNSNNRFFNFLTRFKKNSDFIYYLVVAKSIGYNKKILNLYRLNVKEKLKSKNGVLPSFVNKSEGRNGYSVPRLRGQTHRSQEAMKFNSGNGAKSRNSLHQGGSRISMVQVSSRRERRVSVGKNDDFRKGEDFDGLQMAFDTGLKVSDGAVHARHSSNQISTVQSLNSSLGAGDPLFSSPKTTPVHSALPSRINSVSYGPPVMTPNSSSENLSSMQNSVRKQSSEQTTKSSIVDDAYSSAASDSDSDDEDTSYYVGLELINKFDPKVLIDAEINSPLAGRRKVSANTRNDRSARCSNSNFSSQNSRESRRSPRRRSASATRNRNVSDIQDSLKVNLNDTIFKFRNKDDVVGLFRAVFD